MIFVHRWLGVALCVPFLIWFPSAIGMMYWDFPTVTDADRLERSPALDSSRVVLSPLDALATLGPVPPPSDVRLNTFDGRPAFRFRLGGVESIVYADTGETQGDPTRAQLDRIASAWTRQPIQEARIEPVDDVDQWTVQGPLRALRPMWKYSWPDGEQVYLSGRSGEVVQYTTSASRLGAYLGPIPHWLYFTPLRKHQSTWTRVVIWSSGIGTASALLGLVIALWVYSPSRKYRYAGAPTSIPYRGPKRWHAVFGLVFGVGAVTWAFSGMLSMDPFPQPRAPVAPIARALRDPIDLQAFASRSPRQALAQLSGLTVKELELNSVGGSPAYLATLALGKTRVVPVSGSPRAEFDRARIAALAVQGVTVEGGATVSVVDRYDVYYLDRQHRRPLPVLLVRINDAAHSRYYIDPKTARVAGAYSSRRWVSRWLYHGLHSLDFPWLYGSRPLWDVVVIVFMLGGTGLCVTSLILAWRVVGSPLSRRRADTPGRRGDAEASTPRDRRPGHRPRG